MRSEYKSPNDKFDEWYASNLEKIEQDTKNLGIKEAVRYTSNLAYIEGYFDGCNEMVRTRAEIDEAAKHIEKE